MTSKLWVNYLVFGMLVSIIIWGFNSTDIYDEPYVVAFICVILLQVLLTIPKETKLRQLLNKNRLAGLEKRVSQRKYEYIGIVMISIFCIILHLYYNAKNIHSPILTTITFTLIGSMIGTFIRASADKQEIKEIKRKQSNEKISNQRG